MQRYSEEVRKHISNILTNIDVLLMDAGLTDEDDSLLQQAHGLIAHVEEHVEEQIFLNK
jgi:hypothetical protein